MDQPPRDPKYAHSTRRELSPAEWRRLVVALAVLAAVLLVIVGLAFLVATGEITLR